MTKRSNQEIRTIKLRQIKIRGERRSVDAAVVKALAELILTIGQQVPITVARKKGEWVLVAGLHRIEAVKTLGWSTIKAVQLGGSRVNRKLWEGSENLHRAELTVLERAECLDRWRRLARKKSKDAQVAHPGGRQPSDRGISRTAKELGFSRDEVRRAKAIAGISDEVKAAAKKVGLHDNQSALLAVATGTTPEEQRRLLMNYVANPAQANNARTDLPDVETAPNSRQPSSVPNSDASLQGRSAEPAIPPMFIRLSVEDQKVGDQILQAWSTASGPVKKWVLGKVLPSTPDISRFFAAV